MFAAPGHTADPASLVLMHVVQQHAEEAALLRHTRSVLVRAPHVGLLLLGRHDERIEAHLDGLLVAGSAGKALLQTQCEAEGDKPSAGASFAAAVLALRQRDTAWLDALLALAAAPDARRGLASAFGWVGAETLQGIVRALITSPQPQQRTLAIEACRMHRVNPGPPLAAALDDADPALRRCALRAAGDLARHDLLPALHAALADGDPAIALQAAVAACRLGERIAALPLLAAAALADDAAVQPQADAALPLLMAAGSDAETQEIARRISALATAEPSPAAQRRLIRALALLGDSRHVPWLLQCMQEPALTRLAGEAFSWITGIDLATTQLELLEVPPGAPTGPSDDPADDDVALDEDRDLPWPDAPRVQAHWQRHPVAGQRLFVGRPQNDIGALQRVLREGTQRQRGHAARLLALQQPAELLFPVAAPARRQQRWLQT